MRTICDDVPTLIVLGDIVLTTCHHAVAVTHVVHDWSEWPLSFAVPLIEKKLRVANRLPRPQDLAGSDFDLMTTFDALHAMDD
jgi:hypothetical protein